MIELKTDALLAQAGDNCVGVMPRDLDKAYAERSNVRVGTVFVHKQLGCPQCIIPYQRPLARLQPLNS